MGKLADTCVRMARPEDREPLARLRGEHRMQFLIKSPRRSLLTEALTRALDECGKQEIPDGAVLVDVDPVGLM